MEIQIGMKREKMKRVGQELIDAANSDGSVPEITLYVENNFSAGECIITINNEDMERDEISADQIIVEID